MRYVLAVFMPISALTLAVAPAGRRGRLRPRCLHLRGAQPDGAGRRRLRPPRRDPHAVADPHRGPQRPPPRRRPAHGRDDQRDPELRPRRGARLPPRGGRDRALVVGHGRDRRAFKARRLARLGGDVPACVRSPAGSPARGVAALPGARRVRRAGLDRATTRRASSAGCSRSRSFGMVGSGQLRHPGRRASGSAEPRMIVDAVLGRLPRRRDRLRAPPMRPLRIAHVVTSLVAGGAQRQAARPRRAPSRATGSGSTSWRSGVRASTTIAHGPPASASCTWGRAGGRGNRRIGRPPSPRRAGCSSYVRAVRRGRYDIVDAWLYPDDVRAAMTRVLTGTPIVMSGRRNIQAHDRFGPLAGTIDRVVDRLTDAVVANSDGGGPVRGERRTTRIPRSFASSATGSSWSSRSRPPSGAPGAGSMGVGDDDLVIGCVGRYRPVKGQALLIDAVARARPRPPDAQARDRRRGRAAPAARAAGRGPRPRRPRPAARQRAGPATDVRRLRRRRAGVAERGACRTSCSRRPRRAPDRRDRCRRLRARSWSTAGPGCWCRPRTWMRWPAALRRAIDDGSSAGVSGRRPGRIVAGGASGWAASCSEYGDLYEELAEACAPGGARRRPARRPRLVAARTGARRASGSLSRAGAADHPHERRRCPRLRRLPSTRVTGPTPVRVCRP